MERVFYGPLPDQFGELTRPPGSDARPLVVLIHGGFWREQYQLEQMHPLIEALADRGYASWNIEYRRVGASDGGFPHTLDDVAAALDHLGLHDAGATAGPDSSTTARPDRRHDLWPAHAVIGHSAGGHLALWNASRPPEWTTTATRRPDLTIGLAPVADVVAANLNGVGKDATANFFGGNVAEVPDRYAAGQPDPDRFAGRVVLLHGDADDIVPLQQSLAVADRVHEVVVLEGADHFDVVDPDHRSWQLVFDELAALAERRVS